MSDNVLLSMIVAMAKNRVIGVGNSLPWHLPADLKFFRAQTMGKPVVMGRKTFQSIGRPLPGRPSIVVTRNATFTAKGITVFQSLEEALKAGRQMASDPVSDFSAAELVIIGGAEIYRQSLSQAQRLYVTEVSLAAPRGDAFFPEIEKGQWEETWSEAHDALEDKPAYRFAIYERRPQV